MTREVSTVEWIEDWRRLLRVGRICWTGRFWARGDRAKEWRFQIVGPTPLRASVHQIRSESVMKLVWWIQIGHRLVNSLSQTATVWMACMRHKFAAISLRSTYGNSTSCKQFQNATTSFRYSKRLPGMLSPRSKHNNKLFCSVASKRSPSHGHNGFVDDVLFNAAAARPVPSSLYLM